MITHDLQQGTPEWDEFRLRHCGASEAAAMLGLSKKVKRTELLHMKQTGIAKEFSAWVQENILDYGHEVEAMARPIMERIIGEELYPVTCSEGELSASCDGLTMLEDTAFEHKQWNIELVESVRNGIVPDDHMPQCQQILMVTGAQRVFFTVSDGTEENMVYTVVEPDQEWFERIRAGWAQFMKDLADYQHRDIAEKPKAEAIMELPALFVQVKGEVTASNLREFKEAASTFIAAIKTDLRNDSDFANAEATVKFCKKAEENLDAAKKSALAQTVSIDELMRTVDHIQAQLREKRLLLDNLVKTEKNKRKAEMVAEANVKYAEHVAGLQSEISGIRLPLLLKTPDFGGAIKGLKSLASMHDALDTALANGKIDADAVAKDVRAKLEWCKEEAAGMSMLFPDLQQIIGMDLEAFKAVIKNRIAEHKAAESAKLEAERQRMEAEAKAKAEREAAAKLAAEEARIRAEERANAEAEAKARAEAVALVNREQLAAKEREEQRVVDAANPVAFDAAKPDDVFTFTGTVPPTRGALIAAVVAEFGVGYQTAEQWLIETFATEQV